MYICETSTGILIIFLALLLVRLQIVIPYFLNLWKYNFNFFDRTIFSVEDIYGEAKQHVIMIRNKGLKFM
jgi:hypothetical protein